MYHNISPGIIFLLFILFPKWTVKRVQWLLVEGYSVVGLRCLLNLHPSSRLELQQCFAVSMVSFVAGGDRSGCWSLPLFCRIRMLCFVSAMCSATANRWFSSPVALMYSEILLDMWRSVWSMHLLSHDRESCKLRFFLAGSCVPLADLKSDIPFC
jgi:hypothetical protein